MQTVVEENLTSSCDSFTCVTQLDINSNSKSNGCKTLIVVMTKASPTTATSTTAAITSKISAKTAIATNATVTTSAATRAAETMSTTSSTPSTASSTTPAQAANPYSHLMRSKRPSISFSLKSSGVSRRVSCKDLGNGECEGWLWKKRASNNGASIFTKDWRKFWFKLCKTHLFVFNQPTDLSSREKFGLIGFLVTPSAEKESSKKFSFKIRHDVYGTFFFAAERQDDMAKWMTKLQLACLHLADLSNHDQHQGEHSESEDEDEPNTSCSLADVSLTSALSASSFSEEGAQPAVGRENGCTIVENRDGKSGIGGDEVFDDSLSVSSCASCELPRLDTTVNSDAAVDSLARVSMCQMLGELHIRNSTHKRLSQFCDTRQDRVGDTGKDAVRDTSTFIETNRQQEYNKKLVALRRTLKDRSQELQDIEILLNTSPITSDVLKRFVDQRPIGSPVLNDIVDQRKLESASTKL